jgi:hypothetical protein
MLKETGRRNNSIQYVASELFKQWQKEYTDGVTKLMPVKWFKQIKGNKDAQE